MNNPIQKQFDFTNFAAKVAELNRMHKLVHELSERRWHSGKAEDIERWEKAVKDWKEFSGFGFISMNPVRRHEQKEKLQTRFCDFQSSNVKTCPN